MSDPAFAPDSTLVHEIVPSPNVNERRSGPTDMLILHYTGMDDAQKSLRWLCMAQSQVSAHYFVFEDGRIVQSVPEAKRAWHAGLSCWKGVSDINSRSIGIEIANPGHDGGMPPFPEVQIDAVIALSHDICTRLSIPPERVLAHSDVTPERKQDPGERFPWDKLHQAGVGHYVKPSPIADGRFFQLGEEGQPIAALQAMFSTYGYELEITGIFDERTEFVVMAFQRHFRPARVDGVADHSTIETLHLLLKALPGLQDA